MEDNAYGEDITGFVIELVLVWLVAEDLGGDVAWGPATGV